MDAPETVAPASPPGLSVAAQVAVEKNPTNPVAAVDKDLLHEAGLRTSGWIHAGGSWWREHSNQVWAVVIAIDSGVAIFQPIIPPTWTRLAATVSAVGGVTGVILKYRVQASVMIGRIRDELRRHAS
jgi:hypothetical protein